MSRIKAVAENLRCDGLPHCESKASGGENLTRITNPKYTKTGHGWPFGSKQNMSAKVYQLAERNSLSAFGTLQGTCHQNVGNKLCGGLNSQLNAGGKSPRDLTASGTSGDGASVVAWQAKGYNLESSRGLHSSHILDSSKPKKVRKDVSVGEWLNLEISRCRDTQGKYRKLVKILSNEEYLIACYNLIKGKPGNMTPGADRGKVTLDGLTLN